MGGERGRGGKNVREQLIASYNVEIAIAPESIKVIMSANLGGRWGDKMSNSSLG